MRARHYIFFMGISLLWGECLSAQQYLDLWHDSKTDNFYLIQKKFNEHFGDKGKGPGYKQFKRWEALMEARVYPSGKLINLSRLALDEELRYQQRTGNSLLTSAHTGNWKSLGIKTYTRPKGGWAGGWGRVNCITPHPVEPKTLFIGTPAGGIWKTIDGGNNWMPLSDGIPSIGVSGIAVNPAYPDSIYILTGDGDALHTNCIGVLLSVNGGDTWQSTGLQWGVSETVRGYKLLMHPTNRRTLFAVTNKGIYKTVNGGRTWTQKVNDNCTDMVFKPGSPSILYATSLLTGNFYRSVDNGETWKKLPGFPGRSAMGVTPAAPDNLYLLSGSATKFNGVFLSNNGGDTWQMQSSTPNILGEAIKAPFSTTSQALYDLAIAVSPTNPAEIHVGGINCWKSTDKGLTWEYTSDRIEFEAPPGKYTHADIHTLVFSGNTLYCGSDGGVYYSADHAASWHPMSYGLEITQFYRIGTSADNPDLVFGASQDNGLNKWISSSPTVMEAQVGADMVACEVDYTNNNLTYAFNNNGNHFFYTKDGGTNWTFQGIPYDIKGVFTTPLLMNPTDPTKLYAGYNAVLSIAVGGTIPKFTQIGSGVFDASMVTLAMSAANTSYLYGAMPNTAMKCENINSPIANWLNITGKLPVSEAAITSMAVSAVDVKKVWVGFSGYSAGNKVYQSTNAGASWVNISGSLPNVPVHCITYHNQGKDGIYIGTDIGVFYRDNTMTDWIPFRNGMPNVIVHDLKITKDKIRAATFGRGIWESDLYGSCTSSYALSSSYTLSGDVTGFQFFAASDNITSTANIKGGIGTDVEYKAVNQINLNLGFEVAQESSFLASIGSCINSALNRQQNDNRQYRGIYEGVMQGASVSPQ